MDELRQHAQTWQSIRVILGVNNYSGGLDDLYSDRPPDLHTATDRMRLMKAFLGINTLTFSDMVLVTKLISGLLAEAREHDDMDEGMWSLRDFLRREEGHTVSREICSSEFDPCPTIRSYSNVNFTDGSWDDEASFYEFQGLDPNDDGCADLPPRGLRTWWIECEKLFKDIESIRKLCDREDVQTHTLNNLQCTIQPYFSAAGHLYRYGLTRAVWTPIQFVQERSHMHVLEQRVRSSP